MLFWLQLIDDSKNIFSVNKEIDPRPFITPKKQITYHLSL